MPFDFKAYDAKCNGLTPEELQREWEHYTRLISGASTSTAVSGLAVPFTLGVSTIGVAMAAPAIHNARKKREIIERHLQKHGVKHVTRKRDVLGSMAVSGTIGVVTLGVGTAGAEAIAASGAEHGITAVVQNETAIKVVTHAALDGVGMGIEHAHTSRLKKKDAAKAFQKAGVFQAVQDAKAAEAGYSIQPYNPQTYASGSTTPHALPPPQYGYGNPMSPPPSYPASTGYALPSDPKAMATYVTNPQAQNYAIPGLPSQQHALPQHSNPSSTPYGETVGPASVGNNQSQYQGSASQPYSSYVAQHSLINQSASTSSPGITQQYSNTSPPYSQSTAGGSITSPSHDVYNMGALAQSLPTPTLASVPAPAQNNEYQVPHAHHTPSHLVADQSLWKTSVNRQSSMDVKGTDPGNNQTTAHHNPTPQAGPPETKTPLSSPQPAREQIEQHYADSRVQNTTVYGCPPSVGPSASDSPLSYPQPVTTYDLASHHKEQSYEPEKTTQQRTQHHSFQEPTQQPPQQPNQYTVQPSFHQHAGHSPQHNPQTLPPPPTSTYYSAMPSQVPHSHSHQPPNPTYSLPTPPTPHQAYQPKPWTIPPPPPYPPPMQNAARTQQQQIGPAVQHVSIPGTYDQSSPWNHPAHQQVSQASARQQQHQPVSNSYQPQYQAQQQVQKIHNPPPTPLSPPYGTQVMPQGGLGYFTAMPTAQYQATYNVPKESGQLLGQGPYTPAETPGIV